jgi:hypothetical protein
VGDSHFFEGFRFTSYISVIQQIERILSDLKKGKHNSITEVGLPEQFF